MKKIITIFKMSQPKNKDSKRYFAILTLILILTDITILLDIPFLRQILGFFCFTTIPGLLILHILKLDKIEFLKKFVLSVGLSIAFLMFSGLLINSFHPYISKPLSLFPLLISFNILLIIFAFIAYKRNKDDFDIKDVFNFKLDLKDKLTSPLLFPILFPFMAVFGTYLMNTQDNNIILLVMLCLIPVYVVAIVYLNDKIPEATYPVAVLMIGTALTLMYGLRSDNIPVGDISTEYYGFKLSLNNNNWDVSRLYCTVNACLSVTIVPSVYHFLLGMDKYIFKLVYPLIGSIAPLGAYAIFNKYIDGKYAFLSTFFIMAQFTFITMLGSMARVRIAFLLFVLAMLVFFDDGIDKLHKKILFLVFVVSVIVSHYGTTYIFFILIFLYWFVTNLIIFKLKTNQNNSLKVTAVMAVLFFVLLFFWYGQITVVPFNEATRFIEYNLRNLASLSIESLRSEPIFFGGSKQFPYVVTLIIYQISFAVITIGILGLTVNLITKGKNILFEKDYLLLMLLSEIIIILLTFTSIYHGYGVDRVFFQFLIFLAPALIMGGENISKLISRFNPKMDLKLFIIVIVIIAQFFAGTYMVFQICGVHWAEQYNADGIRYDRYYVHDQDIAGARWLNNYKSNKLNVLTDWPGYFIYGQFDFPHSRRGMGDIETINDYAYLRYENVMSRTIDPYYTEKKDLTEDNYIFTIKNKIYANGGSEVYK